MDPLTSRCTATAKGTGERCRLLVYGGGVCRVHGGRAPQVEARRQVRILEGQARAAGQVLELRDPGAALLAAAQDADLMLQRLKGQLATDRLTGADLIALGDWIDRVGRITKVFLDARIDERQTRLAERQGHLLLRMLRQVERRMGLTEAQARLWRQVVPEELRAVAVLEQGR